MGETPHQLENQADQIAEEVAVARQALDYNLHELEMRVGEVTDWRRYYRTHLGACLGVALGAGTVIGLLLGSRRTR